ncbi:MAG TPA: hypothetical protein VJ953_13800, partial [Saprospiraceae bacterium]|nr:hypothetical protein [Saprospiraceae bacterium]
MKPLFFLSLCFLLPALSTFGQDEQIVGHPAEDLPPYIKLASGFGERPEWSHDGKHLLFLDKPMGEVFEMEVATGIIRPKTRHFNHYGFTRAMYLSNGDILLAGPNAPFDPTDPEAREKARDMSWLYVM